MRSTDELGALERLRSPTLFVPADRTIYHQGDRPSRIYNLVRGWAYLHRTLPDGRRQILRFLMPGAVFGAEPDGTSGLSHGAQSISDVLLCQLTTSALEELSRRHPSFQARRMWMVQRDTELALEQITSLGLQSSIEAIAHLLLELYVRATGRYPPPTGDAVYLPLTQAMIAETTGLTPVHVNRTLKRLEQDGVIAFHRRTLIVGDPARLVQLSGVSEETMRLWLPEPAAP